MAFERAKAFFYSGRQFVNSLDLLYLGFIVSMALLIKQTFGLSTLLFTALTICFAASFPMKYRIRSSIIFSVGVLLPLVFTGLYLLLNSALENSIQQVFLNSAKAKGGASHILTSWFNGLITPDSVAGAIRYILVVVVVANLWKFLVIQKVPNRFSKVWSTSFFLFLSAALAFLFTAYLFLITQLEGNSQLEFAGSLLAISKNHFYVDSALVCVILLILMLTKFFNRNEIVMPLAAISFLFGTGLSGGVSEYGIFLSVAVSLVYLVSLFGEGAIFNLISAIIVSILISGLCIAKLEVPYNWWSFKAPSSKEATYTADSGLSKGLHFSKVQLEIYEEVSIFVEAAKKNCGPNIYVYPAMPLFQLNANVMPPGYLANYWYDFSSKSGIDKQVDFMQQNKIDAVVYFQVPKEVTKAHSELFQQGNQMPQELIGKILSGYLNERGNLKTHTTRTVDGSYSVRYGPVSCGNQ
jgi:hypothetical protein